MSVNGNKEPTTGDLKAASEELDAHLRKLIRRTQRLLIAIIVLQTVFIVVLGGIALYALHNQANTIQHQVYAGQHDACDIFLEVAFGSYGQPMSASGVRGIEDARQIYITRHCAPPTLPAPSAALRAIAAKYGVKLTY